MKNKAVLYFFLIFLALLFPVAAAAQQCDTVSEAIITLREPVYRTPTVWNATYGEEGLDQIVDVVLAHEQEDSDEIMEAIVIAGNFTRDEKDQTLKSFIAQLDNRGKVVWQTRNESARMRTVERILRLKNGYAVLEDVKDPKKGHGFYISGYSKTGKRIGQYPVFVSGSHLNAKGFVETKDKQGFLVAAELVSKKDKEKREAVLYRINKSGALIWKRKYNPGLKTMFQNIQKLSAGHYMLSGEIEQENGRMAAWLMAVDEGGTIGWQRQYPRGSYSGLHAVRLLQDQSMIVAGVVRPLTGKKKSGWVMKLDRSGTPLWQRYYTGEYGYEAKNILAEKDGRFSVLLDAYPQAGAKKSIRSRGHARLLTISPRGYLLGVESHTDSQHAHGVQLIRGHNKERLVVGTAQGMIPDNLNPEAAPTFVFDGWLFAATMLEPYRDPCIENY